VTMPHERMRSLRWAFELLEALPQDSTVSAEVRETAERVLQSFPTPGELTSLLQADAKFLSSRHAIAIAEAKLLFDELLGSGLGTQETRQHLRYTLRHYPTLRLRESGGDHAFPSGLRSWIELEE